MKATIKFYFLITGLLIANLPQFTIGQPIAQKHSLSKPYLNFDACFGDKKPLILGNTMPMVRVKAGDFEGVFLLDFGSTFSTIDPNAFLGGMPAPVQGTNDHFNGFDFFGPQGVVILAPRDHSNIQLPAPLREAGIIGTDFLSEKVFVIDYENKLIYASRKETFCTDDELRQAGFKPVSTGGYYSNDLRKLNNSCVANVPTVPVRIGLATAVAQIDAGFDDKVFHHSININTAFFNAIVASGTTLEEVPNGDQLLSTCVPNVKETVKRYKLKAGSNFEITGTNGAPVWVTSDATIFLKETPLEAKTCGGIGTWQIPAAQLGASFLIDMKQIIFDPFASLVWIKTM